MGRAMSRFWRLFMLVLLLCSAHATTLKQIKTYPEQDKLDVLLLLDSAFSGDVGTANVQNEKMTMVSHITSASKWSKSFQISPIKKLEIIPQNNNLYFKVESRKRYYVKPSISKDKNTLRLSFFAADSGIVDSLLKSPTTLKPAPIEEVFTPKESHTRQSTQTPDRTLNSSARSHSATAQNTKPESRLDASKADSSKVDSGALESSSPSESASFSFSDTLKQNLNTHSMDMQSYWYYIAGFAGIIALLLYIRRRLRGGAGRNDSLKIISQNQIDPKNKVIIIETKEYFYMVLLGEKSNLLLDKIPRSHHRPESSTSTQAKPESSKPIGDSKAFNDEFWNTLKNAK